ncbi:MAG: hypothetical protein AB7E73_01750 [Burkholderiales bacterium]
MSNLTKARTGAVLFMLWGLLHVVGGAVILAALTDGAESAYALYQNGIGVYPAIAGFVLGYLAYCLICMGIVVAAVGAMANWRNSANGLALNTIIVGLTEIGLVGFLIVPGYVSWTEAVPGMLLFMAAVTLGGIACRNCHPVAYSGDDLRASPD